MFDDIAATINREIDGIVSRLDALDARAWESTETNCPGWRVAELAVHVATVLEAQDQAIQHMLAGDTTTPPFEEKPYPGREETMHRLGAHQTQMADRLARIGPEHEDTFVPLPAGTFPTPMALDVLALEYGSHHYDLLSCLGEADNVPDDVAGAMIRLAPGLAAFIGTEPAGPVGYSLRSPSLNLDIHWDDGWKLEPNDAVSTATIEGPDGLIGLFALGRIGADDPRLTTTGHAGQFKTHFPGP